MSKQSVFRFKKFAVDHSVSTMKVGTDGVLLGAWVLVGNATHILDIGTGSGVIALMLAQRSDSSAAIDAVEIEPADAEEARKNVLNSPWPEKVKIFCEPIQTFDPPIKYDLIVSNPPYFSNSYSPPDERRLQARHTHSLTFSELIQAASKLLNADGKMNVILPPSEGEQFIELARMHELFCSRRWAFRTRANKAPERLLLEFQRKADKMEEGEILHYADGDDWSEGYKTLTRDFYLKA